jgi:hypothetical protein
MITRHRNKALASGISAALVVAFVYSLTLAKVSRETFPNQLRLALIVLSVCLCLVSCYYIVKAKGYSSAVFLLAIPLSLCSMWGAMLTPFIFAIALPDRARRNRGPFERLAEKERETTRSP